MPRSILIGVDGSEDNAAAVELGQAWAKRFDCLLVAVGVIDEPTIRGPGTPDRISQSYKGAYERLLLDDRHAVEQALEQFAIRCSEEQIPYKLLEDVGSPAEMIRREAQRYDLVLLGCRTHFRHGSQQDPCDTLERVLSSTPRPVVAVPNSPAAKDGQGVLVAYDGSVQSARALQMFLATGLQAIGPVRVLSVHPDSSVEAAKTADRAVEFLRFHEVAAQAVPVVDRGSVGKLIVSRAEREFVSLIVMGSHSKPALTEFLLGSVTNTALHRSRVPLFIYH